MRKTKSLVSLREENLLLPSALEMVKAGDGVLPICTTNICKANTGLCKVNHCVVNEISCEENQCDKNLIPISPPVCNTNLVN